ncbi:23S rRNA (adenine(2503)-C(2))-methyltransferase RlmN, partial [bacterium]|nr:23S rRNA (adenine(2503)-C(2))-methyltransferase RlmN [bacterium]
PEMTNLSQPLRQRLSEAFPKILPDEIKRNVSEDGTIKIAFRLEDGEIVECVAIPDEKTLTFCLSSQLGCHWGCAFCRTGEGGFKRNLTSNEIVIQILALCRSTQKKPTNIVFMGMGEPLENYKVVFSAIDFITRKETMNFASRRITISTVGIPAGIQALAEFPGEVNLAVSLHAADDNTRSSLVPANKKFRLDGLRSAIERYIDITNRRVTFEVVLLKDKNDGIHDAMNLAAFCKGLLCHVNIIRFNRFPTTNFRPSTEKAEKEYRKVLKKAGVNVTVRNSKGGSILAACGQLRSEL